MTVDVERARVYRLFAEAMDLEPGARDQFVQRQCGGDPHLLREVGALLAAAETDSVATGVLLGEAQPAARDHTGEVYGRFRLQGLIGSGGMGVVYLAVRTDGVPQVVAVKLLRAGIRAESGARFLSEAKLLARVEHPAIARLIDVGIKEGEGWLAVELVRGRPIDEYCDTHGLDLRQRVRLLAVIAGAVATAHRSLVVHRDIKPTNVLVDEDGHPKLIDFGIASALSESSDPRVPTSDIGRLFTPHFAAPEQVTGEPVTVATDVYGLGALAYRLLSGRVPFAEAASPMAYLFAVTRQDVEAPSRVAEAVNPGRANQLRGDLDAIALKALDRDPARRYLSALDFQADLQRYVDGLPVSARAPSLRYRFVKFARRQALAVTLGAVLMVGLISGGVIYALQVHNLAQARDAAARRGEFLERMLKSADPHTGRRDVTVAELLDAAATQLDGNLGHEPLVEASMLGLIADTNSGLGRYPEALSASERQLGLLKTHDAGTTEIARALIARGEILISTGQYAEARPLLTDAVERLRHVSGGDADHAMALNELGEVAMNTGAEPEAERLFHESIAMAERGNDAMHRDMGDPLQNLAVLLYNEDRFAEAAATSLKAMAVYRKYRPPDYPDLLNAEAGYAEELMHLHRPAEAEPVIRDVLARGARVRGPEHPDTLVTQIQLGESLIELKRYDEAAGILRPTAEALDRVLGPSHRYTMSALNDYAIASCRGPDPASGLATEQRVADIRAKSLPAGDWHLPNTQAIIGLCLAGLHRYTEAEPILRAAAAELEARRGTGSSYTQHAYQYLHDLYLSMGHSADAQAIAGKIQD
jgi:tetratricopeptide (TPR) repeat protein